jgi:hypothetical protein
MMARPYTGQWARRNAVPFATTQVWGTGINPVHAEYGQGHPLRVSGRNEDAHTPPWEAVPDEITMRERWGYTCDDTDYTGQYINYDGRPAVGTSTPDFRNTARNMPSVDASGGYKNRFRSLLDGARRLNDNRPESYPSETVSEGWRNKAHGVLADAETSDPSQYEMQTSMTQRYQRRNNQNAVIRGTDEPREPIDSRVAGQKLKVYSGGERHEDMFPQQQDDYPRAFYYRTAGTGDPNEMEPNEMYVSEPLQRTVPDDPSLGDIDVSVPGGYTAEDHFYA